jgi:hypothetical protein
MSTQNDHNEPALDDEVRTSEAPKLPRPPMLWLLIPLLLLALLAFSSRT